MQSIRLTPGELMQIDSAANAAALQLRLGTADDTTHETIAAAINVAYFIARSTPRHQHLMPEILAASSAALAGYEDIEPLDGVLEIYKALARTTPRKAIRRAIDRAIRENS